MDLRLINPRGPMQVSLDESLLDMLEDLIRVGEDDMFNPHAVLGQKFTVEYVKADGTVATLTGRLIAPNYEGSKGELEAYCISLFNKDVIPVWTDKGWRSFYANKVIYTKIEGQ